MLILIAKTFTSVWNFDILSSCCVFVNNKVTMWHSFHAVVNRRCRHPGICSGTSPASKNGRPLKNSPSYTANYRYYLSLPSCVRMHKFDRSYFVDPFSPDGLHAMYTSISTCTHLPGSLPSFYVQPQLLSFSLPPDWSSFLPFPPPFTNIPSDHTLMKTRLCAFEF